MDDQGRMVGLITQADLFKALMSLTGVKRRGLHLAFEVEDRPGSIKELVDVIRQYGGRMASILSTYERAPAGYRNVYLRFYDVRRERIADMLTLLRGKAKLRYMVDHRENRRTIFENP